MNSITTPVDDAGGKIIFITGTDTGVGKTLLTGLLLHHLRQNGCRALAMKPFCCGGTMDAKLLRALQDDELQLDEISPFCFAEPVGPLAAARMHRCSVLMEEVLRRIREIAVRCDRLIVEGCGGVAVPLGEDYTVVELIQRLGCRVVVVSRNQLGTINHTLLTVGALHAKGLRQIQVALMEGVQRDLASRSNCKLLAQWLAPVRVSVFPFLGQNSCSITGVKRNCKKVKKTLAELAKVGNLDPVQPIEAEPTDDKKSVDCQREFKYFFRAY